MAHQPPTISGPTTVNQATNKPFGFSSLISASYSDSAVAHPPFSVSTTRAGYLRWDRSHPQRPKPLAGRLLHDRRPQSESISAVRLLSQTSVAAIVANSLSRAEIAAIARANASAGI